MVLVIALAELAGEREIIFPEIAAIAIGALLAPELSWWTNKRRMFFFVMLCASVGMLIVAFVPAPLWVQLVLAYVLSQLIVAYSGTGFAPMISAIVLPVMLQTHTVVYLAAAALFTGLILILRWLLELRGIRSKREFQPLPHPRELSDWLFMAKKVVVLAAVTIPAILAGYPFLVAPPLMVAYTELANPGSKARKQPLKIITLLTACALAGALSRFLIVQSWGGTLTLASLFAAILVLIFLRLFDLFFPPAGAIALLAMLIPEEVLISYPLQIFLGSSLLVFFALTYFKEKRA